MAKSTLEATEYEYETVDGETKDGVQFRTTVPKDLAEAMGWGKGDKLDWTVATGEALRVEVVEE